MPTLLIRNARCIARFDDQGREDRDASIPVREGLIDAMGPTDGASQAAADANLALFDLRAPGLAGGALHDRVASLLPCASPQAAWTMVNGRVVVRQGRLATLELESLIERHTQITLQLASGA